MDKQDSNKNTLDDAVILASAQYGANLLAPTDAERDALRDGMDLLREAVERLKNVPDDFKHGNLFEYIEAAKFNVTAAEKGSPLSAHITAAEGAPHAAADILITHGDEVIKEVQAKSSDNPESLAHALSDPKYQGMDKLVPKGQEESVRYLANHHALADPSNAAVFADTGHNTAGELHAGSVSSGGTSYHELRFATENPDQYIEMQGVTSLPEEALDLGIHAAEAGFIVGGAISLIRNSIAAIKGDITLPQAAKVSLLGAGISGAKSALTGGFGSVIRNVGHAMGLDVLSKSITATVLAAGLLNTGRTILSLTRREITAEQAMEQIGQVGFSTISGMYAGAVGALFFPPAGAIVGSMGGYIVASHIYQSCIAILKHARLVEKESLRIVAMTEEACRALIEQRADFEQRLEKHIQLSRQEFGECFAIINQGLEQNRPEVATIGLSALVFLFGKKLMSFKEFDDFMINSTNPLFV